MTRGDLPGLTVFGRPLKPVAFGLTLSMVIIAQSNFRGADRGTGYPLSVLLGICAAAAAATLVIGWAGRLQRVAEVGLLLVVGVYVTRAVFIFLSSVPDQSVFFSLSTAIIAGGSFMLEAAEPEGRRERG